jgi:hypothetical protein
MRLAYHMRMQNFCHRTAVRLPVVIIAVLLLPALSVVKQPLQREPVAQPAPGLVATDENGERQRVAEGEYWLRGGNSTEFMGAYAFVESWTLWRLPSGNFEVNGRRHYRSVLNGPHNGEFFVHLSSDFRVSRVKDYSRLRWRADSGPLSCEFVSQRLICSSNAKVLGQEVGLDSRVRYPTGLVWPISLFSLSGITRSISRDVQVSSTIELIAFEELSRNEPVSATIFHGHMSYLGQENLFLAGLKWRADKFEIKIPLHPPFLLWVAPSGLLLAFGPENPAKTISAGTLELMRYRQWQKF